jgi:hypothetical protein
MKVQPCMQQQHVMAMDNMQAAVSVSPTHLDCMHQTKLAEHTLVHTARHNVSPAYHMTRRCCSVRCTYTAQEARGTNSDNTGIRCWTSEPCISHASAGMLPTYHVLTHPYVLSHPQVSVSCTTSATTSTPACPLSLPASLVEHQVCLPTALAPVVGGHLARG